MLSAIFVDRPRLAIVIAIVTTIAGLLALYAVPFAQYPDIVPTQVSVSTRYPGASAAVVDATIAQPIEAQVVGVDKMIYMKSVNGDARLRFRPVMMTSFAFILGLFPLVVAAGASQLARSNVGTPVFGGMIFASFIGIFVIPPLYVSFQSIREKLRPSTRPREERATASAAAETRAPDVPPTTTALPPAE